MDKWEISREGNNKGGIMQKALIKTFLILSIVIVNVGVWGLMLNAYGFSKILANPNHIYSWIFIVLGILFTCIMILAIIAVLFFEKLIDTDEE